MADKYWRTKIDFLSSHIIHLRLLKIERYVDGVRWIGKD